jgi:hypothetical protein
MPLKPLSEITGTLFPELATGSPDSDAQTGARSKRREAQWRADLTRAWGYWRGKAHSEHEAARVDASFEEQLAEGPDFIRYHRGSDFREAPKVHLDGNAVAKLMATYRAIERGSWKTKAKGKHGGALGRPALRLLETFLFVLYRPGKALCLSYDSIAAAAMQKSASTATSGCACARHVENKGQRQAPRRRGVDNRLYDTSSLSVSFDQRPARHYRCCFGGTNSGSDCDTVLFRGFDCVVVL